MSDVSDGSDDEAHASRQAQPAKKKPGRPRKVIAKKAVPHEGIVSAPSNSAETDDRLLNSYEIMYEQPTMFKKIFSLFGNMSVESIRVLLTKKYMKMYAVDHGGKNQIYVRIHGSRINRFYVSKRIEFGLGSISIQKILKTLNKEHAKICWFIENQYERSKIRIALFNDEMEEASTYTIDLEQLDEYDWGVEDELAKEENYRLKFQLPSKYFKKKIADCISLGEVLKIEKVGHDPLQLNYTFSSGKGDQSTSFGNPFKIGMISTIDEDEIFATSAKMEYLKPLSGTVISDTIHVSACQGEKLIFTALLGQDEYPDSKNKQKRPGTERCEIKVLTEIIDVTRSGEQ